MKQVHWGILLFIMTGCASMFSDSSVMDADNSDGLTQRLAKQRRQIEILREQKLLLEKQLNTEKSAVSEKRNKKIRAKARGELAELSGSKEFYAYILQQYREEDFTSLNLAKKLFLKRFPLSVHADNVIFWEGRLHLKSGRLGNAIKSFNEILRSYPKGNKRVSAIFYKGVAYKRLNLKSHAMAMFEDVMKNFPGSQESYRAQTQLRLLSKGLEKKDAQVN